MGIEIKLRIGESLPGADVGLRNPWAKVIDGELGLRQKVVPQGVGKRRREATPDGDEVIFCRAYSALRTIEAMIMWDYELWGQRFRSEVLRQVSGHFIVQAYHMERLGEAAEKGDRRFIARKNGRGGAVDERFVVDVTVEDRYEEIVVMGSRSRGDPAGEITKEHLRFREKSRPDCVVGGIVGGKRGIMLEGVEVGGTNDHCRGGMVRWRSGGGFILTSAIQVTEMDGGGVGGMAANELGCEPVATEGDEPSSGDRFEER
jgi:hypothetical protein